MYAGVATFQDHFSDRASTYALHRPTYPPELIEFLATAAPARATAWDCGCGSGQMSVPLASRFDRVIATDASAEQIAHAGPHPRVEYRIAPAEQSGIDARSIDLVVVAQAAHWFDLPAFYEEARRVARPGAAVALVSYDLVEVERTIDALLRRFYATLQWPPERALVEQRYATLPFPFDEVGAPALFMHSDWTAAQLLGYVRTWSATRGVDMTKFDRDIERAWGPEKRPVRWPLSMRIGRIA